MTDTVRLRSSRAVKYARFCAQPGNELVPVYVKRQAAQWLAIYEKKVPGVRVDEAAYRKVHRLLSIMQHPDLGTPLAESLEDYAWFLITAVLCTKSKGKRYYDTAVLEIARKNFKTFNSAVIFILLLLTEPRFSRFFSVAPDLKLSQELKNALRKIIKSSPALEEAFKVLRSEIRCMVNDSEYTPLAYSEDKMDGKLANAFLADEAGAMDAYPVEAMRSSQITLTNKLGIIISTQYPNDDNGFMDEVDLSKKVLDGLVEGQHRFSLLYEPDDALRADEVWQTDDRVLYQANPVAIRNKTVFEALLDLRALAILYPKRRENFLCKHCNIQYKGLGVEGYVEITKLQACRRPCDDGWWRGRRVWLGLDLSQSDDNTSLAMATMVDDVIYAKVWAFVPAENIDAKAKREKVDYRRFIAAGQAFACGDSVIDYAFVERFALSLEQTYGVRVEQLGYDRWNAMSTVQKLEGDPAHPMECVEVRQHSSVLHSPTKLLREKILSRKFVYDENRLLEINFQNARCSEDTNRNKYVNKKRSGGKVDMVVALINAVYLLEQDMLHAPPEFSITM